MQADQLLHFGFTSNEARIYLALLEFGPLSAGLISKRTLINRRTTYDTIEKLIKQGFLSYSIVANKKVFRSLNPDLIVEKIKDLEKEAQVLITQLKDLSFKVKEETEVYTLRGRKGIRSILNDILKAKEYVVFGSNEDFPEMMKHDFVQFQRKKKELHLKSRTLLSISLKGKEILNDVVTTFRFIPSDYSLPTSTFVYGTTVTTIIWSENPIGIVVENKSIADSYRHYFNALWKTGKR